MGNSKRSVLAIIRVISCLAIIFLPVISCDGGDGGGSSGGGATKSVEWTKEIVPGYSFNWFLEGISMFNITTGWAVGYGQDGVACVNRGLIVKLSVTGSWIDDTPVALLGDCTMLRGIDFPASDEGWVVGFGGLTDAGYALHYASATWTADTLPVIAGKWELLAVDFTSTVEGWSVGKHYTDQRGVILHYITNAWDEVAPPAVSADWELRDVSFAIPAEGWAVGIDENNPAARQGVILHFDTGTWSRIAEPAVSGDWLLTAIDMISTTEGWAVGHDYENDEPVLLHYQGATWSKITNMPKCFIGATDVDFVDATEGWIVGSGYNALHYKDGSWSCSLMAKNVGVPSINAVSAPATDSAWAAGTQAIYTYTGP